MTLTAVDAAGSAIFRLRRLDESSPSDLDGSTDMSLDGFCSYLSCNTEAELSSTWSATINCYVATRIS